MHLLLALALAFASPPDDCTQPICSVRHGDEAVVPEAGHVLINVSVTTNLVDSPLDIVWRPSVDRFKAKMRSHTNVAVYTSDGMPVVLDDLEVVGPWAAVEALH